MFSFFFLLFFCVFVCFLFAVAPGSKLCKCPDLTNVPDLTISNLEKTCSLWNARAIGHVAKPMFCCFLGGFPCSRTSCL